MEKYGMYQGKWLYSCTFDEILKAYTEKALDPTIIYAITDRSKVGTKFLCYCGSMVGTLSSEDKIMLYKMNSRMPFEIWAAKELADLKKGALSEAKGAKVITERPTIESMCKKEEEVSEIELGVSSLAQSLLDGVLGC